ncbi:MAG: mechanosensitive ion channel family protein [archaeon]
MALSYTVQLFLQNPWARFSFTLVTFFVVAVAILHVFNLYLRQVAQKTATPLDDHIIEKIKQPISNVVAFLGLRLALTSIKFGPSIQNFMIHLVDSVLILVMAYIVSSISYILLTYWGHKYAQRVNSQIDTDVLPLASRAAKILLITVALLMIMTRWGVEIGPLMASLGIAGLAISLALKDTLANVFGGISLILDKNFKVDDVIKLESGETGRVMDIGLRSTKILTWDNELIIIPNGTLANAKLINYAKPSLKARLIVPFDVEYGNDPETVKDVILLAAKKHPKVLQDPEPYVRFNKMNDYSLDFKLYVWVFSYRERFRLEDDLNVLIFKTLKKSGIGIPFPTRTLYVNEKKSKSGINRAKKTSKKTAKRKS